MTNPHERAARSAESLEVLPSCRNCGYSISSARAKWATPTCFRCVAARPHELDDLIQSERERDTLRAQLLAATATKGPTT
jgi:predicted Zn-ribbon and HTH transcriptional regulator